MSLTTEGYRELKQMNKDKVGQPFHYSNIFLLLLGYDAKAYFHRPYRQTNEDIAQGHVNGKVPTSIPDCTTINKRIIKLDIKIKDDCSSKEPKNNNVIIAIDSTGIKITNRDQ